MTIASSSLPTASSISKTEKSRAAERRKNVAHAQRFPSQAHKTVTVQFRERNLLLGAEAWVSAKTGCASGSSDRIQLGARCPTLSVVPAVGDRFIGEAEPPVQEISNISPPARSTSLQKRWCDRMTKGKKKQKWIQVREDMPPINRNAGGIDVGATAMWVSVPPDRDAEPVQQYGAFTRDLYAMADWLKRCGIETVAMESTGVYWIPVFQVLEERGIDVLLVNARYAKNVSGRKTDMLDCQWLRTLHTYGLLAGSFQPSAEIGVLRSYP